MVELQFGLSQLISRTVMWAKTHWDWRLGVKLKMKWPVGKDGRISFYFMLPNHAIVRSFKKDMSKRK
jgi:hypothetical protein